MQKLAKYTNLLLLGLVVLLSISLVRNVFKGLETKRGIDKIKENITKLQGENSDLQARLKEAQSGEFIEKQLRDKLGLAKSGEAVIVLPETSVLESLAPRLPDEEERLPDPTWKQWLKLFL